MRAPGAAPALTPAPAQAPLPGLPPGMPKWKQELHWSVSRHRLFDECRRAFFYEVVAPRLPRSPVRPEVAARLKALQPFGVLRGAAVHAALREGIAAARQGGAAERVAHAALDRELRPFALHPERTIAEVANGLPAERAAVEPLRDEGRAMLARFFGEVWPWYAARRYLHHEEPRGLEVGGRRVRLQLDLLTADEEGLLVTDWKTSHGPGDADDSLQLSTYVLWATRALREPPERVRAELVFLGSGARSPTRRTADQLDEAETRIRASLAAMLALDGLADAPPSPGPRCRGCRWATVCEASGLATA